MFSSDSWRINGTPRFSPTTFLLGSLDSNLSSFLMGHSPLLPYSSSLPFSTPPLPPLLSSVPFLLFWGVMGLGRYSDASCSLSSLPLFVYSPFLSECLLSLLCVSLSPVTTRSVLPNAFYTFLLYIIILYSLPSSVAVQFVHNTRTSLKG